VAKDFTKGRIQASEMGLARAEAMGSVDASPRAAPHAADRELAARALDGDGRACTELIERHSSALYRFSLARLAGDRELARDTVQAAMTKALSRLETYRGDSSLFTWLCACCRNEILMHLRRSRSAPQQVELDEAAQPAVGSPVRREPDPETTLLRTESARRVHMTLDLLPPRYAQALEWKYVEQLPVLEIAQRLGVGPKAAESLLVRARNAFRASYEDVLAGAAADVIESAYGAGAERPEVPDRERDRSRS
jgi:RNA polymerase sigma-70 factor (ECF subfamily)